MIRPCAGSACDFRVIIWREHPIYHCEAPYVRIAESLSHLGPTPVRGGIHTAADVERIPDDGFRYEVYRGVLLRMPPNNTEQGLICTFICGLLCNYFRGVGEKYRVVPSMGFDFTVPGDEPQTTMLIPKVAVKADNIRHGPGIGQFAPLIAIEVASPSNHRPEMEMKAQFYLNGGVSEVWIVWPSTRAIDQWTAPGTMTTLTDQHTMTSAHLPGLRIAVSACFDG